MESIDKNFRYCGPQIIRDMVLMTYDEFVRTFQPVVVTDAPNGTINDFLTLTAESTPEAAYREVKGPFSRHGWSLVLREKILRSSTIADAYSTRFCLYTRRAPHMLTVTVGALPSIER